MTNVITSDEVLSFDRIKFSFEDFLEENEQNLPEGMDPLFMTYVSIIEKPFQNITKLPKALRQLPMSAVLHQSWTTIYKLMAIILALATPMLVLLIQTGVETHRTAIGVALVFFILIGSLASPAYLKLLYIILNKMVESKTHPWLIEPIEKPFNDRYHIQWNATYLRLSFIFALFFDAQLIYFNFFNGLKVSLNYSPIGSVIFIVIIFLGHFGITLLLYLTMISYRYVIFNSQIYDTLLQRITARVRGYTDGHESILSKKNYEVVGVLSDTPGLSIRSLGDIPILGFACSTIVFNALIFTILGPSFTEYKIGVAIRGDTSGLTSILLLGLGISLIAGWRAVIVPIFRVWWILRKFRNKALGELDPYLFDEITGVALKRDKEISNETHVLYMIRNYIYIMKSSPVSPIRLIQIGFLLFLYISRGAPVIVQLFGG